MIVSIVRGSGSAVEGAPISGFAVLVPLPGQVLLCGVNEILFGMAHAVPTLRVAAVLYAVIDALQVPKLAAAEACPVFITPECKVDLPPLARINLGRQGFRIPELNNFCGHNLSLSPVLWNARAPGGKPKPKDP